MDNTLDGSLSMGLAGVKMASALFILLGLLFLGFYLLKRYGHKAGFGPGANNRLKLMGMLNIGPKKSIVVVRFLNKDLVLGVTDSQINLLTETQVNDQNEQEFSRVLSEKTHMDNP
ncbi:MAG: flagellar biosynthetic protein FliO [Desulfonatronovibrio sp.]